MDIYIDVIVIIIKIIVKKIIILVKKLGCEFNLVFNGLKKEWVFMFYSWLFRESYFLLFVIKLYSNYK